MKIAVEKLQKIRENLTMTDQQLADLTGLNVKTVQKVRASAVQAEAEQNAPIGRMERKGRSTSLTTAQSFMNDNIRRQVNAKKRSFHPSVKMDGLAIIDPSKGIH